MLRYVMGIAALAAGCLLGGATLAEPLIKPDLVQQSDLTVQAQHVGTMPFVIGPGFFGPTPNLGSPVAVGDALFLIDQNDAIYRYDGKHIKQVFRVSKAPAGLVLDNRQSVLNVTPGTEPDQLYVVFTSPTLPDEPVPVRRMPPPLPGFCCSVEDPVPVPDLYRLVDAAGTRTEFQVFYEFEAKGGKLKNPRAFLALETQSGPTHNGGGMVTLRDGRILFATGDALSFGAEGRAAAQDPNEHVSKLLIIDPEDGSMEVAAQGIRNVQHLQFVLSYDPYDVVLGFADIGGVTAEEVNYVPLEDLIDTTEIENFGWGRNPDGLAREGTFYVGEGVPLVSDTEPPVEGVAPSPEAGFIQPHAQYGRNDPNGGVAVSGPVTSMLSFMTITGLFSDLSSGILYATVDPITETNVPVLKVNLVDENGTPLNALQDLVGVPRPDPRFFRFPNGEAGVLIEATGDFFKLTEIDNAD